MAAAGYLLFYVLGLWPVWSSIAYVVVAVMKHPDAEQNATLGWMVLMILPWTLVTVLMAKLVGYAYSRSLESSGRGRWLAHTGALILVAGIVGLTMNFWMRYPP